MRKIKSILIAAVAALSIGTAAASPAQAGTINAYLKCAVGPCYGYPVTNYPVTVQCSNGYYLTRYTGSAGAAQFTGIHSSAWCRVTPSWGYYGWYPSPSSYTISNFSAYQTYGRSFNMYR